MGSKISIGLVYGENDTKSKIDILDSVISSLTDSVYIQSYKFSKDVFGEEWVKSASHDVMLSEEFLNDIVSNYYAEFILSTNKFIDEFQQIVLRIENEEDYFGILIDLEETEIQMVGYDVAEERIIEYLLNVFSKYKYGYAFCDNEAEIELSTKDVLSNKEEFYSLLMKPEGESVNICKSSWKINGISKR